MLVTYELLDDLRDYLNEVGLSGWYPMYDEETTLKHVFSIPSDKDGEKAMGIVSLKVSIRDMEEMGLPSLASRGMAAVCFGSYKFAKCDRECHSTVLLKLNEINRASGDVKVWLDTEDGTLSAGAMTLISGELASRVCLWHASMLESMVVKVVHELGDLATIQEDYDGFFGMLGYRLENGE